MRRPPARQSTQLHRLGFFQALALVRALGEAVTDNKGTP
jgi:hypothetical protein